MIVSSWGFYHEAYTAENKTHSSMNKVHEQTTPMPFHMLRLYIECFNFFCGVWCRLCCEAWLYYGVWFGGIMGFVVGFGVGVLWGVMCGFIVGVWYGVYSGVCLSTFCCY